jgi:tetratricopeptide (TPR) repeat protein
VGLLITDGYAAAAPVLRRALDAFRSTEMNAEEGFRWLLAGGVAGTLWDADACEALATRIVQLARDSGALTVLIFALTTRSTLLVFAGDFATASLLLEEVRTIAGACGSRMALYGTLALAAFRGRETEGARMIEAAGKELRSVGEGMGLAVAEWATAVLYNGLGRYEDALIAAQKASDDSNNLRYAAWALVELVEAASRSGQRERGAQALGRLTEITHAGGSQCALGLEARSRALLCEGAAAECLYRESIDRLTRTRLRVDLARPSPLWRMATPRTPQARRACAATPSP